MLITLYHHAKSDRYGNDASMLDRHLAYIAKRFKSVHPGERGICLTFDDAYDNFYTCAYPLLQKHSLKAVLGVPTGLIGTPGYCTWEHIGEMASSPLIAIASHTHTHADLSACTDLESEIVQSKQMLEPYGVNTLILPYGRFSEKALDLASVHYRYIMRIGSAINRSWDQRLLYRVPCDQLKSPSEPFTILKQLCYRGRYHFNQWRKR